MAPSSKCLPVRKSSNSASMRARARSGFSRCCSDHPHDPCLLIWGAGGIDADGKPVFVGLEAASSESGDAWEDFLTGLGERGLRTPLLVISDGRRG
jgi:hypothetical protein